MRQFAGVFDIQVVFVISDNGDRMRGTLGILFPLFECKDDSKEFLIVDIIVSFSRNKGFGKVCARVRITVSVILEEYCASCKEGSIGHNGDNGEVMSDIRNDENRTQGEGDGKYIEGLLLEGCPSPQLVLSGEEIRRGNNMGEVVNAFTIEIGQRRGVPVLNSSKCDWIHGDFSLTNEI